VPRHVVTQGIGTILEARHLLLIAVGASKADAIAKAVEGPVTSMCPASAIQLHPHVTVVIDEAAAAVDPGRLLPRHVRRQAPLAVELALRPPA
jgi:glucosamine-6-phosphate deaminase